MRAGRGGTMGAADLDVCRGNWPVHGCWRFCHLLESSFLPYCTGRLVFGEGQGVAY